MLGRKNITQAVTRLSTRRFVSHPALETLRKLFCKYRYLFFDLNTADYWDGLWTTEIASSYRRRITRMYDEIISLIPKNATLLDVGCGIGYLMDRARTEARCDVYGIDISGRAIGHILAKGMKGKVCSVPPIPYPSDTFDVVTSTQLLEHSRKPLAIIREIFRVTRPGGTICISVPEDCCHPDEVAEHNHLFTRDELHYLTRQASQYSAIRFISVCEKGSDTIRLLAVCRKDNS